MSKNQTENDPKTSYPCILRKKELKGLESRNRSPGHKVFYCLKPDSWPCLVIRQVFRLKNKSLSVIFGLKGNNAFIDQQISMKILAYVRLTRLINLTRENLTKPFGFQVISTNLKF